MKNKHGFVGGFIIGMIGFLVAFKVLIIDTTPPSDELAPGMVVILSAMNGVIFGLAGRWIQDRIRKRPDTQVTGR